MKMCKSCGTVTPKGEEHDCPGLVERTSKSPLVAILLAVPDDDPHKLLGDEDSIDWLCGSRPPTAWRRHCSEHGATRWSLTKPACDACVEEFGFKNTRLYTKRDEGALVFVWNGKLVIDGVTRGYRLRRVICQDVVSHAPEVPPENLSADLFPAWLSAVLCDDENMGKYTPLTTEDFNVRTHV